MKEIIYLQVFVAIFVLSATHFAFAEPVKVHRPAAIQKSGKPLNQSYHTGAAPRESYSAGQKNVGPGWIGMETRKSTSRIDGTEIHRRRQAVIGK